MAMEQCVEKRRDSPISDDNPTKGFDCNICLDSVQDPVVTLCGHLYCWPCIYKWLHFETISSADNQDRNWHRCPVCKAEVSDATLIPLYGRGVTNKESRVETPRFGIDIPKRPLGPTCGIGMVQRSWNSTNSVQLHHHGYSYQPQVSDSYPGQDGYPASLMLSPGGMTINVPDPVIRMFSEMVCARVFGDSVTNFYAYPDSYNLAGISSPRVRRHVMQADQSLGRISFFVFCCVFLFYFCFELPLRIRDPVLYEFGNQMYSYVIASYEQLLLFRFYIEIYFY